MTISVARNFLTSDEFKSLDSVQELVDSNALTGTIYLKSFYDGWQNTVDGPKGGHFVHRTGATAAAPTVGSPVAPGTIGTGAQLGYYWSQDGFEWTITLDQEINSAMFGAYNDGVNSDSTAITNACAFLGANGGGEVVLHGPHYVTLQQGTNDKWGALIRHSNITLKAGLNASLQRLNPDISTYALSFPLILVGVPDSDDINAQIENVTMDSLLFVGNNTQHAINGSSIMDGRQAIWVKNTKGFTATECRFTNIDSAAIYFQRPAQFDYANSEYYNTTKCYQGLIQGCRFYAVEHAVPGRALIHAIGARMDSLQVLDNYFEWCDDAVSVSTSYDDYTQVETDTYTDSNLGVAVRRAGRGYTINNNTFYNSSEHCVYLNGMNVTADGNVVVVDNATICNTTQFQIRGRGVSITGGTMTGVGLAGGINTGAMDVSWTGTVIDAVGDSAGGIVNIQSQGLTAYIDARSDFFQSYKPMTNIRVDLNITMAESAQTDGVGIRIYTDNSDANFPNGQMIGVNLAGTVIRNPRLGILNFAGMGVDISYNDVTLIGKPFDRGLYGDMGAHTGANDSADLVDAGENWTVDALVGYRIKNITDGSEAVITANSSTVIQGTLSGGTDNDWDTGDEWQLIPTQNSLAALAVDDSQTNAFQEVMCNSAKITGFQYLFYNNGGGGASINIPYGLTANSFNYIEYFRTAQMREPGALNRFRNNSGRRFMDRDSWYSTTSLENSLSDGSSNSERKSTMLMTGGGQLRFYDEDDGTFISVTLT